MPHHLPFLDDVDELKNDPAEDGVGFIAPSPWQPTLTAQSSALSRLGSVTWSNTDSQPRIRLGRPLPSHYIFKALSEHLNEDLARLIFNEFVCGECLFKPRNRYNALNTPEYARLCEECFNESANAEYKGRTLIALGDIAHGAAIKIRGQPHAGWLIGCSDFSDFSDLSTWA